MTRSISASLLELAAALAAGAWLVNLSSPAAPLVAKAGLWSAWAVATATFFWAGGAWRARQTA